MGEISPTFKFIKKLASQLSYFLGWLFLYLSFYILGGYLVYWGYDGIKYYQEVNNSWIAVNATIVDSNVYSKKTNSKSVLHFYLQINYEYSYNGKKYQAVNNLKDSTMKEEIDALYKNYPSGTELFTYINPKAHQQSLLDKDVETFSSWIRIAIGVLFILAILGLSIAFPRDILFTFRNCFADKEEK